MDLKFSKLFSRKKRKQLFWLCLQNKQKLKSWSGNSFWESLIWLLLANF